MPGKRPHGNRIRAWGLSASRSAPILRRVSSLDGVRATGECTSPAQWWAPRAAQTRRRPGEATRRTGFCLARRKSVGIKSVVLVGAFLFLFFFFLLLKQTLPPPPSPIPPHTHPHLRFLHQEESGRSDHHHHHNNNTTQLRWTQWSRCGTRASPASGSLRSFSACAASCRPVCPPDKLWTIPRSRVWSADRATRLS